MEQSQANVRVPVPQNVMLMVTGQGAPPPLLTWFRDDIPIFSSTEKYSIVEILNEEPTQNTSVLVIHQTTLNDSGQYVCEVKNVVGSERAHFNVTVFSKLKLIHLFIYAYNSPDFVNDHNPLQFNPL